MTQIPPSEVLNDVVAITANKLESDLSREKAKIIQAQKVYSVEYLTRDPLILS